MPRSRFWLHIGLPAVLLAGCSTRQERVYIDLDSLLPAEKSAAAAPPPSLTPPAPIVSFAGEFPPLPAEQILLPATGERLDAAKKLVKEGQDLAFEGLTRQLGDIKIAEVVRKREEELSALEPMKAKLRAKALQEVSELFQQMAQRREIPQLQLALLVGFPDPDPDSTRAPTTGRRRRRIEQAKSWREIIRAIDAEFRARAERMDGDDYALRDYYVERSQILQEVDEAMRKAQTEAVQEARAQMDKTPKEPTVLLTDGAGGRLRAVPGERVSVAAGPKLQPVPAFAAAETDDRAALRARLLSDAEIWVATKGYTLARTKGLARDVTQEFSKWRKEQLVGR